jgi:2'-5' RNA ligase
VVAYPRFAEADGRWVESIRAAHDPQHALIPAHFTLVFPTPASPASVIPEVEKSVLGQRSFSVSFTRSATHREVAMQVSYVFLLPSSGGDQIGSLHDRLYRDALRPYLRRETPYVPHVTIAQNANPDVCLGLEKELNALGLHLTATIDAVHVIRVADGGIATLASFALAP